MISSNQAVVLVKLIKAIAFMQLPIVGNHGFSHVCIAGHVLRERESLLAPSYSSLISVSPDTTCTEPT